MTSPTPLAASLPVKQLDAKHPDYVANANSWDDLDLLYRGGEALKTKAEHFLIKRPKELAEVYAARVQRFTYQNILGTALGWYQTAMFKTDPDIHIKRGDADLDETNDDFYTRFLADCDRSGTTLVDMYRRVFLSSLLFRSAFVLTDLSKIGDQPATLAEQKALGALDPYLVLYDPRQVINWECDAYGNLAWVVIATTTEQRTFGSDEAVVDRWYFFDTAQYAVYESKRKDPSQKEQVASLVDSGPHALADAGRVPIRWIQLPDGLWLASRVYLNALAHLNLQNAYFWGLFMACLPVLYIKGQFSVPPTMTETAYLEIAENGGIGYVEPSGTSYKIASEEISALREEMYRQLYLQAQGRSSSATPSAQSGYSKEMDMAPSRDVLNGLGDILRAGMQAVLDDVATVRGDADLTFDVRGFGFDDNNEAGELATAQLAIDLDLPSDTLEKEIQKRVARVILKDARPEVVQTVEGEIDAATPKSEREEQAKAEQQQRMQGALQTALGRYESKDATSQL